MALEHSPLDEASLPLSIRKVASAAAPPPLKLMAARGLAPLPPHELVVAAYQIAATSPGPLKEAADKTARELPDAILAAALSAPLDPRPLDWLARGLLHRSKLLPAVLQNAATADETVAWLAAAGGDAIVELVAANEMRLLRHPAIITALYLNPHARMSTAQRALELAIRNGVRVEGIPAFEEVKAAIESEGATADASADAAFAGVLHAAGVETPANEVAPPEAPVTDEAQADVAAKADEQAEAATQGAPVPDHALQISRLPIASKLRLAAIGNAFVRAVLVRDTNRVIAMAAVKHPGLTEHEAERFAANRALHEDVIRHIATQRHFIKRYSVKLNLVNNPKCPLQTAISFLGHLQPRDLQQVARSKSIPSALAKAAQHLIAKRQP